MAPLGARCWTELRATSARDHGDEIVGTGSGRCEAIEIEADARHAEIIMHQCKLEQSAKGVTTPGVRDSSGEDGSSLDDVRCTLYRSMCMRANYLSADRPDVSFASKEAARWMSKPCEAAERAVKRIGRYLKSRPRAVQRLERQAPSTQQPIALSSAESEWYALVRAATVCLGMTNLCADYGRVLKPHLLGDATAASGIGHCRGAGKIRHIETSTLWLQGHITSGKIRLSRQPGSDNCADLGTKHVDAKTLQHHMSMLGYEFRDGRSQISLRAALSES
eukprot:4590081-Amphidinium_carterae.1